MVSVAIDVEIGLCEQVHEIHVPRRDTRDGVGVDVARPIANEFRRAKEKTEEGTDGEGGGGARRGVRVINSRGRIRRHGARV